MSSNWSETDVKQNIPFLRLIMCVLFFPCFLIMDKTISPLLYWLAGCIFLYSLALFAFPRFNELFGKLSPLTFLLDIVGISLLIYYAKDYGMAISLFFIFPIFTLALYNKTAYAFIATFLSSIAYIVVSVLNNLNLPVVILQVIVFFILTFYFTSLTRLFHQSYFILANLDSLTKIHNRRFYNHSLHSMIEKDVPFSLILLDIDNFKQLNDTEGHQHGDLVLQVIAQILKKCTRTTDIIARFGGDEFAIILPQTSKEISKNIAERIRSAALVHPKFIAYSQVGLSMGISAYPEDGSTVEEIQQKADEALYVAKARGKNYIHLY
jgi:diguanylate cyclase (GGDEF)-like protein